VTEAELQASVLELCKQLGLLVFHSTDSRRDVGRGFPDLLIAGFGGALFAELKSAGGRLEPEQTTWRYMMIAAGFRWRLWRPADWESGEIERELRAIA
jgi:hypothetical protein